MPYGNYFVDIHYNRLAKTEGKDTLANLFKGLRTPFPRVAWIILWSIYIPQFDIHVIPPLRLATPIQAAGRAFSLLHSALARRAAWRNILPRRFPGRRRRSLSEHAEYGFGRFIGQFLVSISKPLMDLAGHTPHPKTCDFS
jgi:hypothetical protein